MREAKFYRELDIPDASEVLLMHKEVYDKKTVNNLKGYFSNNVIERYKRQLEFLERYKLTKEIVYSGNPSYYDDDSDVFRIKDNINSWRFLYSISGYKEVFFDEQGNFINEIKFNAWFEYLIERKKDKIGYICSGLIFELNKKSKYQSYKLLAIVGGIFCTVRAMDNNFSIKNISTYLSLIFMIYFMFSMLKNIILGSRNRFKNALSIKKLDNLKEFGVLGSKGYIIEVVENIITENKDKIFANVYNDFSYIEVYDVLIKKLEENTRGLQINVEVFYYEYIYSIDKNDYPEMRLEHKKIDLELVAIKQNHRVLNWRLN